jgi:phage tail-like protein
MVEEVSASRATAEWLVANRDPAPRAVGVERQSTISLEVLDLSGQLGEQVGLHVTVGGVDAYDGSRVPGIAPGFDGPRAKVEFAPGAARITLDPLQPFTSESWVEVRASIGEGASTVEEVWTFQIEDFTATTLLAAEAMSPTQVSLSFDEAVIAENLTATFTALERPAVPLTFVRAEGAGPRIELTVQPEMTPGVLYELRARGARDRAGNESPESVVVFRGYRPPVPTERRFDLWKMLPLYARRSDQTTDLSRFIQCLQEVVDLLLVDIDRMSERLDIERASEQTVELWLRELGNPFDLVLTDIEKRRLASSLVELYRLKGTEKGLRSAARFLLGIEIEEITTFSGTPLVLGESLLGVDWELGPSNRFALYAFSVRVPRVLTPKERQRLRTLISWIRPAHTHLVEVLEPAAPVVIDHWELGEAELGLSTILG